MTNPISEYYTALHKYPGNNKQWWVAKATVDDPNHNPPLTAGQFLPLELDKIYSGNNHAPTGHFLLNAFRKDRSSVSTVSGFDVEDPGTRSSSVCFFSGRAWYCNGSRVYYSQIISHRSKAGLCYQEADPTAEDISDLIPNDGGEIPIPEAQNILRLMPFSNGVFAFATNGVWFISGGNEAFSATNIALTKVSSIGTEFPLSIVAVAETIYWWSEVGIHALQQSSGQFGPISGKFGNDNIAESTIQSFYNAIPQASKLKAKAIYDPKNNVLQWLYSSDGTAWRYDRLLIFDVTLQCFYPWKISTPTSGPQIIGVGLGTNFLLNTIQESVTSNIGDVLTTISLDNVTTSVYNSTVENRPTNLSYVTVVGSSVTFSKFNNYSYVDWESFDSVGAPYTSFLETGFELMNDAMRKKQAVRIFCHFRRTVDDAFAVPSSCKFQTKWDWSKSEDTGRWSRQIEAYRPRTMRLPTDSNITSGFPVVTSNNKVRGSGKAVQFRFECSDRAKNFDLLGWSVEFVGNTEP